MKINVLGYILTSPAPGISNKYVFYTLHKRGLRPFYDAALYLRDCFKTQGMCIRIVEENPRWLKDVPDNYKTQEIYDKAVRRDPRYLEFIPDHFKTKEMCEKAVQEDPYQLRCVPDHLKTQEMCN